MTALFLMVALAAPVPLPKPPTPAGLHFRHMREGEPSNKDWSDHLLLRRNGTFIEVRGKDVYCGTWRLVPHEIIRPGDHYMLYLKHNPADPEDTESWLVRRFGRIYILDEWQFRPYP